MNGNRKALGRGLAALIPQAAQESVPEGVQEIAINCIEPNMQQPRRYFDPTLLAELAASLRQHGVLEPVIVRPKEGKYELVVGERRWRAAQEAKLSNIPAIVREMDDRQALELALVENVQREDLNAMEEAEAFQRLANEFGLTQDEIAVKVGKQRSTVANRLRLLELEPEIKAAVKKGVISAGHARALLAIPSGKARLQMAHHCINEGLSVRQVEEKARQKKATPKRKKQRPTTIDVGLNDLEEQMQQVLGTRVRIVRQGTKGQIQIEFYDDEDITRIFELIVGEEQQG